MFTVVTHRGQETFQVPIMGYVNSIAYVQREIDNILRHVRDWARAYVDDIICGAKSLDNLLAKLRTLFKIFVAYNISIKPTKTFLNYPDVGLLGQQVNSLGLITAKEKLNAISLLHYPDTLGALEYYLGLTDYLWSYIHYYAQLVEPLQSLKTSLLKAAPLSGQQRRVYASKTKLPPATPRLLASFEGIQAALAKPITLAHHDPDKILWIDLDASKEFGFDAVIFHTNEENELTEGTWPLRTSIRPLIFLSRLLSPAESHYWPTKLEIVGFVWVLKKVRHLVESARAKVIVQTDHSAIRDIVQQSSITSTTSAMQINVRLVRASQFLRQFRLVVRNKPGKEHIVLDTLSRLASANTNLPSEDPNYSELDALFTYNITLIDIHPDIVKRIVKGYKADNWWAKIWRQIDENDKLGPDRALLPFVKGNTPPTDADPYFTPRPEPLLQTISPLQELPNAADPLPLTTSSTDTPSLPAHPRLLQSQDALVQRAPRYSKADLLYQVDRTTGVHRLAIPPTVSTEVITIAHGEGHPRFSRCYEIISRSWYIRGLTKLLRTFIRHCPQCLASQTRRHLPYGSLQPI